MSTAKKPVIQRSDGMSLDNCTLDLSNRFSPDSVGLRIKGETGTTVRLGCTFFPQLDGAGRGLEFKADSSIARFTRDSLVVSDPNRWNNLSLTPSSKLPSGKLEMLINSSGPAGTEKKKVTIMIKAIEPEIYYHEMPAAKISIDLLYKAGATKDFEQIAPNLVTFRGPADCKVHLSLGFNGKDCGHIHHPESPNVKATGRFDKFMSNGESLFTLDGSRCGTLSSYISYGVCGDVEVKARFKHPKFGQLAEKHFTIKVRYKGELMALGASETIQLIGGGKESPHPDNHYGKPKLVSALKSLAADFVKAYDSQVFDTYEPKERGDYSLIHLQPGELPKPPKITGRDVFERVKPLIRKLQVNDMSLICGGRFDCCSDSKPYQDPHQLHMFGEHADIRAWDLTCKQNARLKRNFVAHGLRGNRENEGEGSKDHWHCTVL